MAETYGVMDWRALPLVTAATLAQGLPASSRSVKHLSGVKADDEKILLAVIADRLGHIAWMFSEDGQNGTKHPPSILEVLTGTQEQPTGFDSGEDYQAAWAAITGTGGDNNA
ncbi:MAG: hypothetical protein II008_06120 [Oscillospiraceae bacterium]|nr:hypothetical protein [Oscillospiraceae bacterium]